MTTVPLIRSPLFTQYPNIEFGMSTVQGAPRTAPLGFNLGFDVGDDDETVRENLDRFLARLQTKRDHLAIMRQVHGTTIQEVTEPGIFDETDALVTRIPRICLAVRTADCAPVMIYAPGENVIAAVHAGWRGTAEHIAAKTVAYLQENFGIEPDELLAFIGPAAGVRHYEVGEEVAQLFDESVILREEDRKPRLDLKKANAQDLEAAGIQPHNIEISPYCTITHTQLFHSWRRDGEGSGRMLAAIMLKDEI